MKVLAYRVRLLEPVLVTALEGDPNSAVAYDFLPGSVLRGAIIKKYRNAHKIDSAQLLAADTPEQTQRHLWLFFNGATRYLNGYPVSQNARGLPTPASWLHRKEDDKTAHDFAVQAWEQFELTESVSADAGSCPRQVSRNWERYKAPFCTISEQTARLIEPDRRVTVHTARNRRLGRAAHPEAVREGEETGAVYRYDALAAGQIFGAVIVCDVDSDAEVLEPLLTGEVVLGGSRNSGYGHAVIEPCEVPDDLRDGREAARRDSDRLIITLLSDAILCADNGQHTATADTVKKAVEQRLGVPLRYADDPPGRCIYLNSRYVGGFNRKWGLPLVQTPAVQMGSVLVFAKPNCDESRLRTLEVQGIGERRAEGFGRVAINCHTQPAFTTVKAKADRIPGSAAVVQPGSPSVPLAQQMANRLLRQRLDEQLIAVARHLEVENPPRPSQISRLRSIIADVLMQESIDMDRIGEFLTMIGERSAARKQFEQARVGGQKLLDWLRDTCQKTDDVKWKVLLQLKEEDFRPVGGVRPEVNERLRQEYALRLIDLVLARATKKGRKEVK